MTNKQKGISIDKEGALYLTGKFRGKVGNSNKQDWEEEFDNKFKGWKNTKFDLVSGEVEYTADASVDSVVVSKMAVKDFISRQIELAEKRGAEREREKLNQHFRSLIN